MIAVARRLTTAAHGVAFRVAVALTAVFITVTAALLITEAKLQPVLSGSMSPAIPRYSLVLAVPVRADAVRVGDVVVFQPPAHASPAGEASVMHRVVELHEESGVSVMRTRGDANTAVDPWTIDLRHSALYRVQAHVPHVGVALQFLHNTTRHTGGMLTWPGLLLLIGVAGYAAQLRGHGTATQPLHGTNTVLLQQISDELRNPLSSIVGYAELLTEQGLAPEYARVVQTISRQARRLSRLADDLSVLQSLDKAIDTGTSESGTCLLAILHQTRDTLTADLVAHGVDLIIDVEGDTGVLVEPRQFQYALQALLQRAIDNAQPGSVLQVLARRSGETVTVTVNRGNTDAGESPTDPPRSLAWAVAHRILQPHLAELPQPARGTAVSIHLPAAEAMQR